MSQSIEYMIPLPAVLACSKFFVLRPNPSPPSPPGSYLARSLSNSREIHICEWALSLPTLCEDEAGSFMRNSLHFFHVVI